MTDKQKSLESVEDYTWARLATLLPDATGNFIRDKCLNANHVAQAFVHKKILQPARSYPWKLLHGNRRDNLRELAKAEGLRDEVSVKIKQLVLAGYNEELLLDGLDRLADAKWTTTAVEQAHGSMAHVHRCHLTMEPKMLCTGPSYAPSVCCCPSRVHPNISQTGKKPSSSS